MPKNTNDNEKEEKLKYIGLDLNNIPEFFTTSTNINYKPLKVYEENAYRVYRYVPISKIQILLTPNNRLNTIKEKYSEAYPLKTYLKPESEKDMDKHAMFIKMLEEVKIEEIERLSYEQERLNKHIPFKVRFEENYLWQIYYSDIDDIYFMLVPTLDLEYASFFYLLKKQIEYHKTQKEQMIFVPIVYENYSNKFLKNSEIQDIEKYLNFFTKEWPNIYDVYDKNENLSLQITGNTVIYENLKSVYKNKYETKEDVLKFYKFLKGMFILSTELPHHYKFIAKTNKKGELEFYLNDKQVAYEDMFNMLEKDYKYAEEEIVNYKNESINLGKSIEKLKIEVMKKEKIYLTKEKQITTYLKCRKTFFGKVRYFFRLKKKKNTEVVEDNIDETEEGKIELINPQTASREFYTIEDILKIYKELDAWIENVKNLRLDESALVNKLESMNKKIKNANLYIEEIDKHEKSIFEFWKFANKDENLMLNQGVETETINQKRIEKVYNYEEDKEEIGTLIDKNQRNTFSKEEADAIYIASTYVLDVLNNIEDDELLEHSLSMIKEEIESNRLMFNSEKIDIFGGMSEDNTKVRVLVGKKHREIPKDKLRILDVTRDTTLQEYKEKLKNILDTVKVSFEKQNRLISIPFYIVSNKKENLSGLKVGNLSIENAINQTEDSKINICKIKLKEETKVAYFSNIIYYDNYNKTLPLGMEEDARCLIDLNMYKLKEINKDNFKICSLVDEFKIETKEITLYEYELIEK